jgi:Skp family chaperone for outer membrane proteins
MIWYFFKLLGRRKEKVPNESDESSKIAEVNETGTYSALLALPTLERKRLAATEAKEQRDEAARKRDEAKSQRDEATRQRNTAEERAAVALSRRLAAQSDKNLNEFPVRSLLLALESINSTSKKYGYRIPASEQSLIDAVSKTGGIGIGNHEHYAPSVAFSPDGTRLASGSEDKTIRVWNLIIGQLIGRACDTAGRNLTCNEWSQHFGDERYRKTCPGLPGPETCK